MIYSAAIIDADFCIKLGASAAHPVLQELVPFITEKAYIHQVVLNEIIIPASARNQIQNLLHSNVLQVITEEQFDEQDQALYQATFKLLFAVMSDPRRPHKNEGEICSLAMAKVMNIPIFLTDEKDLQPIIDRNLNTQISQILCVRIQTIIELIKAGRIDNLSRKDAKLLWIISGKEKIIFDKVIWPI